jgi:hypothetical protein
MLDKIKGTINNGQSRDTDNIGNKTQDKSTLEKTEGAINNGQSRDTDNIGNKTQDEDKQSTKHNTTQRNLNLLSTSYLDIPRFSRKFLMYEPMIEKKAFADIYISEYDVYGIIFTRCSKLKD